MPRRVLAVLVLTLLPLQMTAAESAAAAPPKALVLQANLDQVVVAWLPPTESTPDAYRVYGYSLGGTASTLVETVLTTANVPAGYVSYAVVAVYGPDESDPAQADPCGIAFSSQPPPAIYQNCV